MKTIQISKMILKKNSSNASSTGVKKRKFPTTETNGREKSLIFGKPDCKTGLTGNEPVTK